MALTSAKNLKNKKKLCVLYAYMYYLDYVHIKQIINIVINIIALLFLSFGRGLNVMCSFLGNTTVIPPAHALIYTLPPPLPAALLPNLYGHTTSYWLCHLPAPTQLGINTPHTPSIDILHSPAYEDGTDNEFRNVGN